MISGENIIPQCDKTALTGQCGAKALGYLLELDHLLMPRSYFRAMFTLATACCTARTWKCFTVAAYDREMWSGCSSGMVHLGVQGKLLCLTIMATRVNLPRV